MPPDSAPHAFGLPATDFGAEWGGWHVAAFGIRARWDGDWPPPWQAIYFEASRRVNDRQWQVWLFRVWREGSPLALERRSHPKRGRRDMVVGLERPHNKRAHYDPARQGLELLRLAEGQRRGRKPGDGRRWDTAEDFLEEFWDAVEATQRATGRRRPHFESVRRRLDVHQDTLYTYLAGASLRWQDVEGDRVTRANCAEFIRERRESK